MATHGVASSRTAGFRQGPAVTLRAAAANHAGGEARCIEPSRLGRLAMERNQPVGSEARARRWIRLGYGLAAT
jgi:hypothetical protein